MYVHVRARTDAKKETLVLASVDHFVVSVTEPAERNLANRRIIELLAQYFGIATNRVRIINGHHSPSKLLSIDP